MNEKVKWPFPTSPFPVWWKWSSSITILAVGTVSKLWLCYLNSTKVYRKEILFKAVNERPKHVPLITSKNIRSKQLYCIKYCNFNPNSNPNPKFQPYNYSLQFLQCSFVQFQLFSYVADTLVDTKYNIPVVI